MIIWAICLWFLFFLVNYAEITHKFSAWVKSKIPAKVKYATECAICWPFWITLIGTLFCFDWPIWGCLVISVIHLFIDLSYRKLSGHYQPYIGGHK